MIDPRPILGLRAVRMLRELARKWWRLEIGLADAAGRVLEDSWGPVPPGGNDFCRAVQGAAKGRKRCTKSVREVQTQLRRNQLASGVVVHTCHLGLSMVACPIRTQDAERGLLFACGFSVRDLSRTRVGRLRGGAQDLVGKRFSLDGERVPVLTREELARLSDLLKYCAEEAATSELGALSPVRSTQMGGLEAFADIVARSRGMRRVLTKLGEAAGTANPVLLVGEAGTGKRTLARALHQASPRRSQPFEIFTGSPDPTATENRLFGLMRGASLGRPGLVEAANPGSLYLAAGSWSVPAVQVKLLRLLQEGSLVPLGGQRPVEVDTRLVLGMEGEFDAQVAAGHLRRDLADRLAPHLVLVPPLRERREDLAELIAVIVAKNTRGRVPIKLLPATVDLLVRYHWPGNAAELEEEVRQLAGLAEQDGTSPPESVSMRIRQAAGYGSAALTKALKGTWKLKQAVAILERELIHEGLVRTRWNKSQLARQLGISRTNLLTKLLRYDLERDKKQEE